MGVTFYAFNGAVAQNVTVAHAKGSPGVMLHVLGVIERDTAVYDSARGEFRFDVTDQKDTASRMTIVYARPKPDGFDKATSVDAIGKYEDGVFKAHELLVKCPSKYSDTK